MEQKKTFLTANKDLISIKDASKWASNYLNHNVTKANISYLLQYGRINKYIKNGTKLLSINELKQYYIDNQVNQNNKQEMAEDIDWNLSFINYKEAERTKHVHRLHPYKGKFIPQLVEYFLDSNINIGKDRSIFNKGDIVLDPFCGSGTTLVQANELGLHAIGIDVSRFNAMISNTKLGKYNRSVIWEATQQINRKLDEFRINKSNKIFEAELTELLNKLNRKYFPSPEYKIKLHNNEINEKEYSGYKEAEALLIYKKLIKKHKIKITQKDNETFLGKWFVASTRDEIDFIFYEISKLKDVQLKQILAIILSRSARSCRATTHADLGTLKSPVTAPYYCKKHGKICRPIFSINGWWKRYSVDTINRLREFDELRTDTHQICLAQDSRKVNIVEELQKQSSPILSLIKNKKIQGIFSSPPYVGLIDYHQQHAYSYEIFGFERNDNLEIGPLFMGQGIKARELHKKGIAEVLMNCKKFMQDDFNVFLVANDKYNLYPEIADIAGMQIVNEYKRPVLNRVEKDRSNTYYESIFHLKNL